MGGMRGTKMKLRCLALRHPAGPVTFNEGLYFSTCAHCGTDLIRQRGATWQAVPRGYRVVWRAEGQHCLAPWQAMTIAHGAGSLREQALGVARLLGWRGSSAADQRRHIRLVL
jgi:hypothetical protein